MAELWPERATARPRNVADWMVDRLDEYTSMSRGSSQEDVTELRREQSILKDEKRRLDGTWQNRVLVGGALAAPALLLGAELGGGFGFRAARSIRAPAAFDFPELEAWQKSVSSRRIARLSRPQKEPLWEKGGDRYARAYGARARSMGGDVHHRIPLAQANQFPSASPNRLANLVGVPTELHPAITESWRQLEMALGRAPTQAESIAHALKLDKLIEPYLLRPGLPRPPPPLPKGKL